MSVPLVLLAGVAGVIGLLAIANLRARRKALAQLRAGWGGDHTGTIRDFRGISEWHRWHRETMSESALIDDRTWEDLHLDRLFESLDHATSRLGQQLLYDQLRRTLSDEQIARLEARTARVTADAPFREQLQLELWRLKDRDILELWRLALPGAVPPSRWFWLVPVVPAAMLLTPLASVLWAPLIIAFPVCFIAALALRASIGWRVGTTAGAFRQLRQFFAVAETEALLSGPGFDETAEDTRKLLSELRPLARISGWVGRSGQTDLLSMLMEIFNLFFLVDLNALRLAERHLNTSGAELLRLIRHVGEIDAALALASWRVSHSNWVRPSISQADAPVQLHALRHPLLDEPVPHSLELGPPHGLLITGSNMSGKSTLLRNVGVGVVMAQSINTVLADHYAAPRMVVRSCIGRGDDLLAGKSYYLVEVERVLAMVAAASTPQQHLLLFDELFRGTNTVERIAAGEAVLRAMLQPDATGEVHQLVLAATHDGELVDLLAGVYDPWHLSEMADAEGLRFTYELRPGPATSRNAITLLRLHGAPVPLLEGALARAALLDRARLTRDTSNV